MNRSLRSASLGARAVAVMFLLSLPSSVWAIDPLSPDNPYFRPGSPGTQIGGEAYLVGPVPNGYTLVASSSFPYGYNGSLSEGFLGSVSSKVYQNNTDGTLVFSYQINNLAVPDGPGTEIGSITLGDVSNPWGPFTITSAGSDGLGSTHGVGSSMLPTKNWSNGDPYSIAYNGDNQGLAIDFDSTAPLFGTQLVSATPLGASPTTPTSDTSAVIWLATNAKNFQVSNVGLSDTSRVGTSEAYAPAPGTFTPTPEPGTISLAAIGCVAGVLVLYRRRKTN